MYVKGTNFPLSNTEKKGCESVIDFQHVTSTYEKEPILQDVTATIEEGEFVFLKGKSGSGKSTLLKLLYRDISTFEGTITLNGYSLREMEVYETRRLVGTIFQSFELLDRKTALENVMLAGEVFGKEEKTIKKEAIALLEKVGLSHKLNAFPHQLSGGEQQRVAIARALLNRPKILLADEPTGNLDPENAHQIMTLLQTMSQTEGITMLIVTHAEELTRKFPAKMWELEKGKVIVHESH